MTPLINFLIGFAIGWLLGAPIGFHIARERAWRLSDRAARVGRGVPFRPMPNAPPKAPPRERVA
jgi:ABC-type nitrate/sulfonate/bicarbonate transport system permease component